MLKSNKGITLTSLIIYLIVIVFVSGIVSTMLGYFYKNSDQMIASNLTKEQYTRFLSYILKDVNSNNLVSCKVSGNNLTFTYPDNKKHEYIYQNKKIYYSAPNTDPTKAKKIMLCRKSNTN